MELVKASSSKVKEYEYKRYNTREFYKNFSDIDYENQLITTQFVVRVPVNNTQQITIFDWSGNRIHGGEMLPESVTVMKYSLDTTLEVVTKGNGYHAYKNDGSNSGVLVDPSLYHTAQGETEGSLDPHKMNYHLFPSGTTTATAPGLYIIEVKAPFNADYAVGGNLVLTNNAMLYAGTITLSQYIQAEHWFTNNEFMKANGFKNGTYDLENREITWEVGFNYNIRSLAGAQITDAITGKHEADLTSFQLEKWDIGVPFTGNDISILTDPVNGKDYTKGRTVIIDSSDSIWSSAIQPTSNGFTLAMDTLLNAKNLSPNSAYILTYKTKMKDDLIDNKKYDNDFSIQYNNVHPSLENSSIFTTTADSGQIVIDNLPYGDYQFIETDAPTGYELDKTPRQFSLSETSKSATVLAPNKKVTTTGVITLTKVDKDDQNKRLSDATFKLQQEQNGVYVDVSSFDNLITDGNGQIVVKDLPFGNYQLIETVAPNGYIKDETPVKFTLSSETLVDSQTMTNKQKPKTPGSIEILKVDGSDITKPLAGAEFDLVAADGQVYKVGPTDANGVAKLDEIPVGTYQLKETRAPEGYALSTEAVTVAIGKGATASVTVRNDKELPKTGILRLTKVDAADSSIRLGGATFTLTNGDQTQTIQTDASGLAFVTDLQPGNYILTETVAPTGYQLNEKSVFVTIRANEITEYTFSNSKKPVVPNPDPNGEDPNNGTNPDTGTNPKPDPNGEDPNNGTNPDTGTNPKPDPNGEDPNSGTNPDAGTKPKDPNTLTPNTGTNPSTGTNTGKTPIFVPGTTTSNKKPTLPQTNGESTIVYTLLGLVLVVVGAALLVARRRKMN